MAEMGIKTDSALHKNRLQTLMSCVLVEMNLSLKSWHQACDGVTGVGCGISRSLSRGGACDVWSSGSRMLALVRRKTKKSVL